MLGIQHPVFVREYSNFFSGNNMSAGRQMNSIRINPLLLIQTCDSKLSFLLLHSLLFFFLTYLRYHISLEKTLLLILTIKTHDWKWPMSSGAAMKGKTEG